ncbi:MAG: hypothetical protein ISQ51_01685 [Synechococcus sp. BS307-5m-G37]|nr:hypothetical protein [Synechococcus sp. BS307-5m-G37]
MIDPLAALKPSQWAQLKVLCWVASVDGDVASEERALLSKLSARLLPLEDPEDALTALQAEQETEVEAWVAQLQGSDERMAMVSLAFQMVCSSQGEEDASAINADERVAYRRLLDALDLPDAQVQEAEWAARQALKETPALVDRLNQLLFGWGAWPSMAALEASGTSWL